MKTIFTKGNSCSDVFRFGRILPLVLAVFLCVGCAHQYCPSYSSTSYNRNFNYAPEKHLTYKPVKVHEFKAVRVNKSDKKASASYTRLHYHGGNRLEGP